MKYLKNIYFHIVDFVASHYMLIHVALIYIYSRVIYYFILRVFFNSKPLLFAFQYLDPTLLKNDLLQSLFYMHSQPPLFNMFLGIGLKLFSDDPGIFYHYSFLFLGLIFSLSLYLLLIRLNISKGGSFILTVIFIVNPAFILYENLLFYTHPIMVLLLLSAFLLNFYLKNRSLLPLFLFFTVLAIVCLTQSFFHIAWFAAIVLIILLFKKNEIKRVIFAASIPFLIVLSVYLKNYFVFNEFTSSTWFGMNFSKITTFQVPQHTRDSLFKAGSTSYLSTLTYFPDIKKPSLNIAIDTTSIGIPALDEIKKSSDRTNYNNINYIRISETSLKDALTILKKIPNAYLNGLQKAISIYFMPPDNYSLLGATKKKILLWADVFDEIVYGCIGRDQKEALFLIILFPLLILYGIYYLIKEHSDPAVKVTVAYILFIIFYVTIVGILFDVGENNRFRYVIDPYLFVLAGFSINNLWHKIMKSNINDH